MLEEGEYSPTQVVPKVESSSTSMDTESMMTSTTRKSRKNKNKRRFSDEQIKSLETMFESESKLEPRTKLQLARELDLQPRQIAIWFQNRRARWKSKQLERDYSLLKTDYDSLASQFESLKKEKQSLVIQLQKLNNMMLGNGNSTDGDSDNGETKYEAEQKPSLSLDGMDLRTTAAYSDDENCKSVYLGGGEQDIDLANAMDPASRILASPPGNWNTFDSTALLDQSCGTSQWWEIWS